MQEKLVTNKYDILTKVHKVIESCTTGKQIIIARKYCALYFRTYNIFIINELNSVDDCIYTGIVNHLTDRLREIENN